MKDRAGIECADGEKLSDLDFADDIALLENAWEGMQATTSTLEEEAKKFGLVINVANTKIKKPTVHLDGWGEFGRAGRYLPVYRSSCTAHKFWQCYSMEQRTAQ